MHQRVKYRLNMKIIKAIHYFSLVLVGREVIKNKNVLFRLVYFH